MTRLSDLGCPDFVGTTGFGCCIPPYFSVMRKYVTLLVGIGAFETVVERVNGWCFRGIYNRGLWDADLHVSVLKFWDFCE